MKDKTYKTSIGGQALIEGIMMKGPSKTSVAVRKPDGDIELKVEKNQPVFSKVRKIPVIRGVFNMIFSFIDGYKYLTYSAEVAGVDIEDEEPTKFEKWLTRVFGDNLLKVVVAVGSVLGVALAMFLFMYIPGAVTKILSSFIGGFNDFFKTLTEGIIKIIIFMAYLALVAKMSDIKRVFMYHGGEHKCIHCYEKGLELTVENVRSCSRFHKRCGTSFLVLVLIISIIVFSVLQVPWGNLLVRVLIKLLCLPLIAGLAYEVIKIAGRFDNALTAVFSAPGLWIQRLTTKEPDDSMIEVAIAALKEVLPEKGEDDRW